MSTARTNILVDLNGSILRIRQDQYGTALELITPGYMCEDQYGKHTAWKPALNADAWFGHDKLPEIREALSAHVTTKPSADRLEKLVAAARPALEYIEDEIAQRQTSGNDEDWADLAEVATALREALP